MYRQGLHESFIFQPPQLENKALSTEGPANGAEQNVNVVAIISHFYPFIGGAQTHLRQVSDRLARRGHHVAVLTHAAPGAPICERLGALDVHRFQSLPHEEPFSKIYRFIEGKKFENSVFYLFLNVGNAQERTRWTINILRHLRERSLPRVVRITSSGRVEQLARQFPEGIDELKQTNYVIALNPGIRKELLDAGVDPNRMACIPNGVDTERFRPDPTRRRSSEERVFLSISRVDRKKKLPELVDIWGRDLDCLRSSKTRLRIVGSCQEPSDVITWEELRKTGNQNPNYNIEFVSGLPHSGTHEYYQEANVFITLSTEEGMSNAMLEAMSSGLAIVAPATEATAVLIRDPWNGFLFTPDDLRSASVAIRRALNAPEELLETMARRNRELIEKRHSIELIAERFSKLFNSCASANPANVRFGMRDGTCR